MATAQHPVPTRTAVHHNFDWLWIGLSVILVALIAGAVAWVILRPAATVLPLPTEVSGFEYSQEATTGQAVQPGVTGEYFGYSGELYPAAVLAPSVMGFEYDSDATTGMLVQPGVTGEYFGYSGELYPAAMLAPSVMGFEYDHEVTPGHVASPGVTSEYFGYSGELFADD
jgi:hypothetical protein